MVTLYLPHYDIDGVKQKLVSKLLKSKRRHFEDYEFVINQFSHLKGIEKPTTINFHKATFNFVDKIDLYASYLRVSFKFKNGCMVLVLWLVKIMIGQCFTAKEESTWQYQDYKENNKELVTNSINS